MVPLCCNFQCKELRTAACLQLHVLQGAGSVLATEKLHTIEYQNLVSTRYAGLKVACQKPEEARPCAKHSFCMQLQGLPPRHVLLQGMAEVEAAEWLRTLGLRYFTPGEVARLHSFPASFSFPGSTTRRQQYALLGNSLSVRVVSTLLRHLLQAEPAADLAQQTQSNASPA